MHDYHTTVLLKEGTDNLKINDENGVYVDTTLGGGGHSISILSKMHSGTLISLDQDGDAIKHVQDTHKNNNDRVHWILARGNFKDLKKILNEYGIQKINGIIYDIGVSSYQIDTKERGFSFRNSAPLDMRMDTNSELTAEYIINNYDKTNLNRIFREFGEEKHAKKVTNKVLEYRESKKITNSRELIEIINQCFGDRGTKERSVKKVFQALRVEVNQELSALSLSISQAFEILLKDGICNVITFQPLERKIIEDLIVSNSDKVELVKIIEPNAVELVNNLRSKSAKMYVISKTK